MVNRYLRQIGILIFFTNCVADVTADLIDKTKSNFTSKVNCENNKSGNALDCSELLQIGSKTNGVYTIWPKNRIIDDKPLKVYCDMETDGGGWTLIQRRYFDGAREDFDKDWRSYKEGFGDIQKEFWLGNDNIFALSNQRFYSARYDLNPGGGSNIYALYDTFWIDGEDFKYTLHIANYSGNAGDAMAYHQKQKFSAKDEDNDKSTDTHCAVLHRGGWWYNSCYDGNPNGRYREDRLWRAFSKERREIKGIEIMIRPRNFKLPAA